MESSEKKGFRYWFTNVFWYHYGKISLVALFLLVTAVWFTIDALKKETYDLNVAVILNRPVARDDLGALYTLLGDAAGDVNGDGKTRVNIVTVNLADEENREGSRYQMMLYLSLPEYTIFLMDERESGLYAHQDDETFQVLGDYGIATEDETGRRVALGRRAVLAPLGEEVYACLADWTVSDKGDPAMTAAAVRALQALLASPAA